jgi:hypothetical protein
VNSRAVLRRLVRRTGGASAVGLLAAGLCSGSFAAPAKKPPDFDPTTKVDGATLQVVFGQRALFHLDAAGRPVIDTIENGKLADAHLKGVVKETYAPPPGGQIAAALDASPEKRASVLKLWNGMPQAMEYRLAILMLHNDKLEALPVKPCALAAGQVFSQSWPQPVVAVALTGLAPAAAGVAACKEPERPAR